MVDARLPGHEPVDGGLAHERTELAWNRSGLAVAACIAVILRRIWPLQGTDQIVALACISAGALVWAVALAAGSVVSRRAARERGRLSQWRACAITGGTLAIALTALVLAFFPPS